MSRLEAVRSLPGERQPMNGPPRICLDGGEARRSPQASISSTTRPPETSGSGRPRFASDGLESDAAGRIYLTDYEDNAVIVRQTDGSNDTLVHHPTMLWPDTLSVAADGSLYVTCNQLHRQPKFHRGEDLREKPFVLFRTPIDGQPVRLK